MSNKFIGTGIVFPIVVNADGNVDIVDGIPLLEASIKTILYWPQSQRFFNAAFGSRLFQVIEEPNDLVSKVLIRAFIIEAINNWEKRVIVKDLNLVRSNDTTIILELTYIIRSTNTEQAMTFPFYKNITI